MKLKSFIMTALMLPTLLMLTGCGPRRKNVLTKLAPGIAKKEVLARMGEPEETRSPFIDNKGDMTEIWEYSLATVDENRESKRFFATLGTSFICFPLCFVPLVCMESPYSYDNYFVEFNNNYLTRWGKVSEMSMVRG